jgi:uncharacterized protein (DUF2267 family)
MMTMTELIAQRTIDGLHEAIRVAWQAGYDQAMCDMNMREQDFVEKWREEQP